MTAAEIRGFNVGISTMLAIAEQSADRLATDTKRPLAVGFAIEALRELADAGREMLIVVEDSGTKTPALRAVE